MNETPVFSFVKGQCARRSRTFFVQNAKNSFSIWFGIDFSAIIRYYSIITSLQNQQAFWYGNLKKQISQLRSRVFGLFDEKRLLSVQAGEMGL